MPSTALRQNVITQARRVVVKLGTNLLIKDGQGVDAAFVAAISEQIAAFKQRGIDVTVVTSGAIGVGCRMLDLPGRPTDVSALQAVASVGQSGLMSQWHDAFAPHGLAVAQMLVTREDFEDRDRYLNIRNCITENDTVSVEEIRFGDNDVLAALVTNALRAELLILLTVVPGLKGGDGQVLDIVHDALEARALVLDERSAMGSGGMQTKLEAARIVTDAGEVAVIADGREPGVLRRLLEAEKLGTVFVPANRKLDSRSRWIGMTVRPAGSLTVDDGAAKALTAKGTSLLAIGITEIVGQFEKGDVVVVRDQRGRELARGLINYNAEEARRVMGQRTDAFESLLGRKAYDEVIHRDNMVVSLPR